MVLSGFLAGSPNNLTLSTSSVVDVIDDCDLAVSNGKNINDRAKNPKNSDAFEIGFEIGLEDDLEIVFFNEILITIYLSVHIR